MASRGEAETSRLKQNVEEQLDRLMQQLIDLEESKDDLDEEEYLVVKEETIEQLKEFNESLTRMKGGDLSLVNELNRIQLAIRAAISDAFKTPEVIQMFAKKQPGQLRQRLAEVERDSKIGKLQGDDAIQQKVEILIALKRLGELLNSSEETFLQLNSSASLKEFDQVSDEIGDQVLDVASSQVKDAKT